MVHYGPKLGIQPRNLGLPMGNVGSVQTRKLFVPVHFLATTTKRDELVYIILPRTGVQSKPHWCSISKDTCLSRGLGVPRCQDSG